MNFDGQAADADHLAELTQLARRILPNEHFIDRKEEFEQIRQPCEGNEGPQKKEVQSRASHAPPELTTQRTR